MRNWKLVAGGGVGIGQRIGTPTWRMFAGLDIGTFGGPAKQTENIVVDGDGDNDGIPDSRDGCPTQPEDFDGFEDSDGCPDDDNDGDGLADAADKCPNNAEDRDGIEDEDGCPEFDADGDGFADADDKCPTEAETFNEYRDEDGCPDTKPTYVFKQDTPVILNQIRFEFGKDRLLPESFGILAEVANSLRAQAEVRVRIEGHTDDVGKNDFNQKLSERRALAVMNWLVDNGIEAGRLTYQGFGESRPIVPNDGAANRALNRRVQFATLPAEPAAQ
jgi:outer membrane protein OmpA-like peptidoglycan-associated protein